MQTELLKMRKLKRSKKRLLKFGSGLWVSSMLGVRRPGAHSVRGVRHFGEAHHPQGA